MTHDNALPLNPIHYHVIGGYPFIATGHLQAIEEYSRLVENYKSNEGILVTSEDEYQTTFNDDHKIEWFPCACGSPGLANMQPEEQTVRDLVNAIFEKARRNFMAYSRKLIQSIKGTNHD